MEKETILEQSENLDGAFVQTVRDVAGREFVRTIARDGEVRSVVFVAGTQSDRINNG